MIREFRDQNNVLIATAELPEDCITGGAIGNNWQHERVPFTYSAHAVNGERNTTFIMTSEEMWSDIRNQLYKQSIRMMPDAAYVKAGLRDFIEPDVYLNEFAKAVFGGELNLAAKAELPSFHQLNRQYFFEKMMNVYNTYFTYETQAGSPTKAGNIAYEGMLHKYEGSKDGKTYTVLAGMDYKGVEYYSSLSQMMGGLGNMFGGLFGSSPQKNSEPSSKVFGHGKPLDVIEWGCEDRFIMIAPKENEESAIKDFVSLVSTFRPDVNIVNAFEQRRDERAYQQYQSAMAMKGMAAQSMQNLQYQQQKLTQQLARNSAQMSAGIMDSWDKKMASQSRMSQNYSEAVRGVNTYVTSSGRNVEVSVAADHAYENKYGDVYGVSGNAPDSDLLSKLNWTEINKK